MDNYTMRGQVAIQPPPATYRNLRGQVATEFFIYAGVFLIVVIAAAGIVQFTQSSEVASMEYKVVKESGYAFSDSINLAARGGKGFNYTLAFPPNLLGYPYNIYFGNADKGVVFIHWAGPQGNMSYAYNTAPSAMEFHICNSGGAASGVLVSNAGASEVSIYNDGSKLQITRSCS